MNPLLKRHRPVDFQNTWLNLRHWYKRKEAELRALGEQSRPLEISLANLEECDTQIDKHIIAYLKSKNKKKEEYFSS